MTLRKFVLPDDLGIMNDLIIASFVYPENPEWSVAQDEVEEIKDTISTLKRIYPLYRIIGWMSPVLRDAMRGFIWEEDGEPVGMVTVARRGATDSWMVGNVCVLPEYRRRGIARKLVEAGLDFIREQNCDLVVLDVIAGNVPAYKLYESLGFSHYTSILELEYKSEQTPPLPPIPDGYVYEKLSRSEWEIRMEMAKQVIPEKVQEFDPVTKGRYHIPLPLRIFIGLINKIRGVVSEDFTLRDKQTNQVIAIGYTIAQSKSSGRHSFSFNVRPENPELVQFLIPYMLNKVKSVSSDHAVDTVLYEWRYFSLEEHEKLGFNFRKEGHRLGMKL